MVQAPTSSAGESQFSTAGGRRSLVPAAPAARRHPQRPHILPQRAPEIDWTRRLTARHDAALRLTGLSGLPRCDDLSSAASFFHSAHHILSYWPIVAHDRIHLPPLAPTPHPPRSMTETATSPSLSRPTTTPAARPPAYNPGSVGQAMPPFLSPNPRLSTPHNPPPAAKSPSPNYFGFQDGSSFLTDTPARQNWSPPSSAVRSTAAVSPSVVPLDQNPDFEAFRRQSEGKAFNLGAMGNSFNMSAPAPNKAKKGRSSSRTEQPREAAQQQRQSQTLDPSTADTRRSPKRVLSPGSAMITEQERRASPASFLSEPERRPGKDATLDSQPKFATPPFERAQASFTQNRAETLPTKPTNSAPPESEQALMVTAQHVVNLMESKHEQVLLLDLRVSTQYAKSRITSALNLCIPTTLLKRPSFNVHKLADTFKDADQRQRFERWRNSSYIIVYDASSSLLKDAQICVNTIKKFRSEGYEGNLYILKGGFTGFSSRFSSYIEEGPDSSGDTAAEEGGPDVAPVVGGCPMPGLDKPANPFFGNIRQNMDLIGGVGQMPLSHPSRASRSTESEFPEWLSKAANTSDNGKKVAGKFEGIEKREKRRMEEALSGKVQFGTPKKSHPNSNTVETNKVQIAGIEKGNKNRYNNIWPFEHSRVKLQSVPHHGCDYINASFVKSAWTNKKYISTQAPIPGTFNDFWNVVWQQDVRVIVMLTAEKEGAQVKAHNYWDKKSYGPLQLDFLSEKRATIEPTRIHRHYHQQSKNKDRPSGPRRSSTTGPVALAPVDAKDNKDEPYVIVRRFTLSHGKQPFEQMREITQLQYSSSPDFGAPAHPAHLLGLVEQTNAVARSVNKTRSSEPEPEGKRPVLVHCSAGCGRTGTFCTVDSVIDMLKRQKLSRDEDETTGRDPTPMDIDGKSPPPPTPQKAKSGKPGSTPRASTNSGMSGGIGGGFFEQTNSNPYADATTKNTGSSPMREEGIDGGWLHRDDQDLVEKTVEDFRHQRISMVQSLRQYVLCYESVMEWLVEEKEGRREGEA